MRKWVGISAGVVALIAVFLLGLYWNVIFASDDYVISMYLDGTSSGGTRNYYANFTVENGKLVGIDSYTFYSNSQGESKLYCSDKLNLVSGEWERLFLDGYETQEEPELCGGYFDYRSLEEINRAIDSGKITESFEGELYCHGYSSKGCFKILR